MATNAAMVLARPAGMAPRDIAAALAGTLAGRGGIVSAEVAGPGFLNLRLRPERWFEVIPQALAAGAGFGRSELGAGRRVAPGGVVGRPERRRRRGARPPPRDRGAPPAGAPGTPQLLARGGGRRPLPQLRGEVRVGAERASAATSCQDVTRPPCSTRRTTARSPTRSFGRRARSAVAVARSTTRGGVEYRVFRHDGRSAAVTWERGGRPACSPARRAGHPKELRRARRLARQGRDPVLTGRS